MLACGYNHSLLIDADGLVWTAGGNDYGQCGLGNTKGRLSFCPIVGVPCAVQVSAGEYGNHSAILDNQGTVWMFGSNLHRGDGEEIFILSPTKVQNLPKIIMVSCGYQHIVLIDDSGTIWGLGDSTYGQLGCGRIKRIEKFAPITTPGEMGRAIKISCGYRHSVCLSEKKELWSTGFNQNGQLGVGHNQEVSLFQRTMPLTDETELYSFDCGSIHTAVLDKDGGVWTTGNGNCGQLGLGNTRNRNRLGKILNIPPMVYIVCGGYITMMTDKNGVLYACGENSAGQLGVNTRQNLDTPQAIPNLPKIALGCVSQLFTLFADNEGGVWTSGSNQFGQHGTNNRYTATDTFVHLEGIRANTMSEKRFFNTKRAHQ